MGNASTSGVVHSWTPYIFWRVVIFPVVWYFPLGFWVFPLCLCRVSFVCPVRPALFTGVAVWGKVSILPKFLVVKFSSSWRAMLVQVSGQPSSWIHWEIRFVGSPPVRFDGDVETIPPILDKSDSVVVRNRYANRGEKHSVRTWGAHYEFFIYISATT